MIPGNASAAFTPNLPKRDAKALSLFLSHSFKPFSSLGRGPTDVAPPPPPGSNASTSTPKAILIAVSTEAIVMPYSLNSILILLANEVSLSNTLAIVSLMLVIWYFSLPLRISITFCLAFSSSFSLLILFSTSSCWSSVYSMGSQFQLTFPFLSQFLLLNQAFLQQPTLADLLFSSAICQNLTAHIKNFRLIRLSVTGRLYEKLNSQCLLMHF